MNRNSLLACAALPLLGAFASCAAAPRAATGPWLQRFAESARFVPAGMTSLWFSEPYVANPDDPAFWLDGACRVVRCASSFRWPRAFGMGAIRGVTIEDHEAGVPAARLADLGERGEAEGGIAIWHRPQLPGPSEEAEPTPEQWAAVVDDRFVVTASDEPLLRAALAKPGGAALAAFDDLPPLPADTVAVVFRLPRAAADEPGSREDDQLPYACVLAAAPVRIVYWTQAPVPDFPPFGWTGRRLQQPPFVGCDARPEDDDVPMARATLQMVALFGALFVI